MTDTIVVEGAGETLTLETVLSSTVVTDTPSAPDVVVSLATGPQGPPGEDGAPGSDASLDSAVVLAPTTSTRNVIQPTDAGVIPVIARGADSQTANLQEWQDSASGQMAYMSPAGALTLNFSNLATTALTVKRTSLFDTGDAATTAVIVKGRASQSADLQQWQSSAGTVLSAVSSAGHITAPRLGINGAVAADTQARIIAQGATYAPLVLRGAASQTANLQEWQDSAGTVLGKVSAAGNIHGNALYSPYFIDPAQTGAYLQSNPSSTVSGAVLVNARSAANVGLTIRGAASQSGDLMQFQDSTGAVLSKVTSGGAITAFSRIGAGATPASPYRLGVYAGGASDVPMLVKGAASQSGNLMEIQNSAGTALVAFNSGGFFNVTSGFQSWGQSGIGNFQSGAQGFVVNQLASRVVHLVKGISSQAGNLQEWQNDSAAVLAAITPTGALDMLEQSDPATPAANRTRLYARDSGAGITQIVAKFPSGNTVVVAEDF